MWGLKQNPFPSVGDSQWDWFDRLMNSLGGDPVKDEADLRERLKALPAGLTDDIVTHYKPGQRTKFQIDVDVEKRVVRVQKPE